jgi:uncharacterized protein (TIGR02145 family)
MNYRSIWQLALIAAASFSLSCCSDKIESDAPGPEDQKQKKLSVATSSVWKIELNKAVGEGKVVCDGGNHVTARGFVWGTEPNPTLTDNSSVDGDGIGAFKSLLNDLQPNHTYYAKAYATNSTGTVYGTEQEFRTRLGTVTDIDGNVYHTLAVGRQIWMAENLRVTRYANGDPIPNGLDDYEWERTFHGAYAIFPHNQIIGLESDEEVVEAYGLLYNWFVVDDPRGICPPGWRVPDNNDWVLLIGMVGGGTVSGAALKSKRTDPLPAPSWYFPNEATDKSGWSGLPGGRRHWHGGWGGIGSHGNFLSSTELDSIYNYSRILYHLDTTLRSYWASKQNANSIRCLRDAED